MTSLKRTMGLIVMISWVSLGWTQITLLQESFETNGEGTRYNSTPGNGSGTILWTRTNLNPASTHADAIGTGSRHLSYYWGGENVSALSGGTYALVTLNPVSVSGFSSLDVQISLGISRFGQDRWERDDIVRIEYNMDGSGWTTIGLFRGDDPGTTVSGGGLSQDTDNNIGTYGPYGTEVTGTFTDFTFSIPSTGNNLQVRVRGLFNGTEELGFDNIRVRGVASSNSPPVLASIEGSTLAYSEGDPATQVSNTISVADADDVNLTQASVSITGNFDASEDVLAASPPAGISESYNTTTGVLSFLGTASLTNYQAALRSVTYENSDGIDASAATRTLTFQVNDGTDNSGFQTRDISIATSINTSPVSLPFTESFETSGEGLRYESNNFTSGCLFAERSPAGTNAGGCFLEVISGANGSFVFNTEDTDANGGFVLTSQPFDISSIGAANITIQILLGVSRDDENRWENDDQFRIEYSIDGGAYTIMGLFTGNNPSPGLGGDLYQDTDNDPGTVGPFGKNAVSDVFSNYTFTAPGSGNTLTYRIVVNSNGTEELAFDNIQISATTFPVELLSFEVQSQENKALLTWTTASELNNQGFEIEHKTDNAQSKFEVLDFVNGNGYSQDNIDYQFLTSVLPGGRHYFRLRQVDFDGHTEVSPTVELTLEASDILQVFPNPTTGIIQFAFSINRKSMVRWELFDQTGRKVDARSIGYFQVGLHQPSIDISSLAPGYYFYRLFINETVHRGKLEKF